MSIPSIPTKDKPLITDTEKERLTASKLDPKIKKRNNLIVKRKIQSWLRDTGDVLFALEHMTETRLKNSVSDEDIYKIFKITETLLDKMYFEPVQGYPQHPFTTIRYTRDGVRYIRKLRANDADFERNWQVQEFVRYLRLCYHSDPEKESPAYKKYRVERENKELRAQCKMKGIKQPDFLPGEENELK